MSAAIEDIYEDAAAYERTFDLPDRVVQDFLDALVSAGVEFVLPENWGEIA